jgi:NADH:ubiquinone oxidoreductase subunit 3 (subunit A)
MFVVFEAEILVFLPWIFFYEFFFLKNFMIMLTFFFLLVLGALFEYTKEIFPVASV